MQRYLFLLLTATLLACLAASGRPLPAAAPVDLAVDGQIAQEKYVALTFDDGPRASTTAPLLDGLRARGASATFFLIGQQIAGQEELVARMQREGHQVGNHTWSHMELKGQPPAVVQEEIGRTDAALQALLGEGSYWVRPPYGLIDQDQRALFTVPLVYWSVDPEDWKLKDTQKDVEAVLGQVQPGDIILMHDSVPATVDAALAIVDALQNQGYTFVTVEELLALEAVAPQAGVLYHTATYTT